ncbi:hypothetical protein Tco_0697460 [Tanacetum coccineum]
MKENDSMEKLARQYLKEVVSRHGVTQFRLFLIETHRLQASQYDNGTTLIKDRRALEFQDGDKVMLKVSPWKGVIRFGKRGKLNPRYIRPFKILAKVGTVAYRLELPRKLSLFIVLFTSTLEVLIRRTARYSLEKKQIDVDDKLNFIEEPIEIMDREVKR